MIIKQVLLSSLWFFLSIWNGSAKAIVKVKAMLRNYLWSGAEHSTKTRINWFDCCAKKHIGGLDLIDPQEAMISLLCKWVITAYLLGSSNLQVLLRNKLWHTSPAKRSRWPSHAQWGLACNHAPVPGSQVWSKV
jgi:hypothetical protein